MYMSIECTAISAAHYMYIYMYMYSLNIHLYYICTNSCTMYTTVYTECKVQLYTSRTSFNIIFNH